MKKFYSFALLALTMGLVFVSCDNEKEEDPEVSYTLSISLPKTDSLYLTKNLTEKDDFEYYYIDTIDINPFRLFTSVGTWNVNAFGFGTTFSSLTDTVTGGSSNNSAITTKGVKTNAYFTVSAGGDMFGLPAEISFKDGKAYKAKECYVTNATYAYLAIRDQNVGGYGSVKEWTKDDQFKLTITGYNGEQETGHVDFLLADGLDIVSTWQQVDLTRLGEVTKIAFSLSTTDVGQNGMNTPLYFCLDQLTVTE